MNYGYEFESVHVTCRYLSTWFLMDVASTIPFETIAFLFTGKHQAGITYSVLGMLRLWRIRRVMNFFTRLQYISTAYYIVT